MYLNCHSYYSLRYGTFSEVTLLELALNFGVKYLALTDVNTTSACLNYIRKAQQTNIKPVVGIDFKNGVNSVYIAIAQNNKGYQKLNTYLTEYLHEGKSFPVKMPSMNDTFIIYPFEQVLQYEINSFEENEFIGVSVNDLRRLPFTKYSTYTHKLVVLQTVTFRNKRDFNAHRLLRAIDLNTLLSKLPAEEQANENEIMFPLEKLNLAFQEYFYILENTVKLMEQCSINFDFSSSRKSQNQQTYTESKENDLQLLRKLCEAQLTYRYPDDQTLAKERMEKELLLIKKMDFVSYFLINYDIVSYAKAKGFYYVGRGSGANSIVAYLLKITDVDPLELDLYFERFINLFRSSPPDFDIDFSWKDREKITQYIFKTFKNVALMGTYVTFNYKGVVRELGKVFGLPKEEIDKISDGDLSQLDTMSSLVLKYGKLIEGMPNYISVHASGIIISEYPLQQFSATFTPPKGFATVQFDMHIAEDIGIYKFDILGQRGLAKIKETLEIIQYNRPNEINFDIHDITKLKHDVKINKLLAKAQCMGCFYVESPAMRMLLKKLEVDNYLGLVAASSIIRPGVAKSGMMREYILRHKNPERRTDAHPLLRELMKDTYGVMVYQEDVIKVAHHFANLTLAEADVLRRGMSGKFRSRAEFQEVEAKFISNCMAKGYSNKIIKEVWMQIESFAGYAFAKGHSASYAVESYQSLFLKAYFPLEFMVAVINNGGGFYSKEIYIHELKMLGAKVQLPCINSSVFYTFIINDNVYLGLSLLQGLEDKVIHHICKERTANGEFISLDDFIIRINIGIEQLSILIRIGAFRFTQKNEYELLWEAHLKHNKSATNHSRNLLFPPQSKNYTLPVTKVTTQERIFQQLELLGFTIENLFSIVKNEIENTMLVKHMQNCLHQNITMYGSLVAVKRTRTHNGKEMYFATFLDQAGEVFDVTLFPDVSKKYPFEGKGVYKMYGKVVEEFDFLSIEIMKMNKEVYIQDPRLQE
ncbi:DNA polymerase III subunit alpha [Zhouia sp. PK063]|uniref:DNA polymerase III subunit alpha n=1 Tax=Zhouia sp. PK063 TaxID=3373602 RepID=UPI0037B16F71